MKKLFSLIFVLNLFFGVYAQDDISLSAIAKGSDHNVWHALKTKDGVTISYQYVDCGPIEYIQFKITNSNSQNAIVSLDLLMLKNGVELETHPDDMKFRIQVNGNSSIAKACGDSSPKLAFFVKEANTASRFDILRLANLNITLQ